jgi:hypothetical protein
VATPDPQLLQEVHRRLLANDPTAPADLAQLVFDPLRERLRTIVPSLGDPTLIDDAVVEAVLGYAEHPTRFDPTKRDLFGYLIMSARGDANNAIAARKRRDQRERPLDVVELPVGPRKRVSMAHALSSRVDDQVVSRLTSDRLVAQVQAAVETPQDAAVLQLMFDGERRTERFAAELGIEELPTAEQRRAVKQYKDRLKKRLERLGLERDG